MTQHRIRRRLFVVLLGLGIATLIGATLMPEPHVTAVRTEAVAGVDLSPESCGNGGTLPVAFDWQGSHQNQTLYSPDCGHAYARGEPVTIYVASNAPSDIGPTEDWILHPDEHDPFDFIGPSGLPGFLGLIGFLAIVAAGIGLLRGRFGRPRPSGPPLGSGS